MKRSREGNEKVKERQNYFKGRQLSHHIVLVVALVAVAADNPPVQKSTVSVRHNREREGERDIEEREKAVATGVCDIERQ